VSEAMWPGRDRSTAFVKLPQFCARCHVASNGAVKQSGVQGYRAEAG